MEDYVELPAGTYDIGEYMIVFLDMLSAKSRLLNQATEEAMVNVASCFVKAASGENHDGIKKVCFSDNVVFCIKVEDDEESKRNAFLSLSKVVATYMWMFSGAGFDGIEFATLIRGGMTIGKLAISEQYNFIIGSGLVNAHDLESKANYPRVIFDKKLEKYVSNSDVPYIKDNESDCYYLDYLECLDKNYGHGSFMSKEYLKILRDMIDKEKKQIELDLKKIENLEKDKRPDEEERIKKIEEKYIWLEEYLLSFVKKYPDYKRLLK